MSGGTNHNFCRAHTAHAKGAHRQAMTKRDVNIQHFQQIAKHPLYYWRNCHTSLWPSSTHGMPLDKLFATCWEVVHVCTHTISLALLPWYRRR